jgi:sporulation protein YlmC with PRC-barrel domain
MAGIIGSENATQVLTARSIMRDKVVNPQGENLGDIKDLMMDVNKGCIAYAVLDFGGFLGIGSKYFAVPWESFTIDEQNEQLVLNVDKQRLKDAPGFDKDHWPLSNDTYYNSVNQYYGTGMGSSGQQSSRGGTSSGMGSGSRSNY